MLDKEKLTTYDLASIAKQWMIEHDIPEDERAEFMREFLDEKGIPERDILGAIKDIAKSLGTTTKDLIRSITQTTFGAALLGFLIGFTAEQYTKHHPGAHCASVTVRNLSFATMVNEAMPDGLIGDIVTSGVSVGSIVDATITCLFAEGTEDELWLAKKAADEARAQNTATNIRNSAVPAAVDALPEPHSRMSEGLMQEVLNLIFHLMEDHLKMHNNTVEGLIFKDELAGSLFGWTPAMLLLGQKIGVEFSAVILMNQTFDQWKGSVERSVSADANTKYVGQSNDSAGKLFMHIQALVPLYDQWLKDNPLPEHPPIYNP